MSASAITIDRFRLEGFRAYLTPQTLSLRRDKSPLSLAIFAPNAKGKSSLVDSFEFYFSPEGTLKRLGRRTQQSNAGPIALGHVNAEEKSITPTVHFWFREGSETFDDPRAVGSPLPISAKRVRFLTKVPFVIHGYELRGFVEGKTPEDQYKELSAWLGLDPLLSIQNNLRSVRRGVQSRAESKSEFDERLRDLRKETKGKISEYDDANLCAWFNEEVLRHLDRSLQITKFSEQDTGFLELVSRKETEERKLGLTLLKKLLNTVEELFAPGEESNTNPTGYIPSFEAAVSRSRRAEKAESEERTKASNAIFEQVWSKAQELIESSEIFDKCPICNVPFTDSPQGSRDGVHLNLKHELSELATYRKAKSELDLAESALSKTVDSTRGTLKDASDLLTEADFQCKEIVGYSRSLKEWDLCDFIPDSKGVESELIDFRSSIAAEIDRVEKQQGEHTYDKALRTAKRIIEIRIDLERIERTKIELASLKAELDRQALAVNKAIVDHTQSLIVQLESLVETLYREIQGDYGDVPPIKLELSDQDEVNQQRAQIKIDFSENRKGVVPSGYLSDSQIHTLALALRLAAIRMFNSQVGFIVLDDVVTSYDADHRKSIARTLAKHFSDYQIVVVTHDEQFFHLMRDHMQQSSWIFKQIRQLLPESGPVFHDHRTSDQTIEDILTDGRDPAGEMRQVEEEWLLKICRDFRVRVEIRPLDRPYQYDRSELADSLASFLNRANIKLPDVTGFHNSFINSLKTGVVENSGSHFSDNPNRSSSPGDSKARWEEFKQFRTYFLCSDCDNDRFKRPGNLKRPVCQKCETPFDFQ